MSRVPLRSPCCDARVVGMIDVTVHPRLYAAKDGRVLVGQIVDTLASVRRDAADGHPDVRGAYCQGCGGAVDARALAGGAS